MRKEHEAAIGCEVVARVFDRRVVRSCRAGGQPLAEAINETLYHERERLRKPKGSLDPDRERSFYAGIRRDLPQASPARQKQMLREVLQRYSREITGHFSPLVYGLATRAVPVVLTGLLNGLSPLRLVTQPGALGSVDRQVVIQGAVDHIRKLEKLGTLIFVPTHSSNLDSVIMGHSIYRLGLPPVTYGAGLNLFSNPMMGFFMRNLGAYTVDRRKTDPLYRECLKEYTTVTLEFGYHNLFFPGGTRNRANVLESRLKKGLLGSAVRAFFNNLRGRRSKPRIFVVPCTISYPLVLEAATLMDDHLQREGKSRYIIEDDEFSQARRWMDFARGLMSLDQRIYLTLSRPLDPFGNDVDEEGYSLDPCGRLVDGSRYLTVDGEFAEDSARDREYTRDLAARVLQRYRADNVVFPTNVLSYACFDLLRRQDPESDLYRFLRNLGPESSLAQPDVEREVARLLEHLKELAQAGRIRLCAVLSRGRVDEVVASGLRSLGIYHGTPVIRRKGIRLHVGDGNLILYYRNRLAGYALPGSGSEQP